jgi:TonB family protein
MLLIALAAGTWALIAQDYSRYVGKVQEFCGDVVTYASYSGSSGKNKDQKTCDLALHVGSPSWWPRFRIILDAAVIEALPEQSRNSLVFHKICATGTVTREKKFHQIRVSDPAQIRVLERRSTRPFGEGTERVCGDGATEPVPIREVKPQYTMDAMRAFIQGTIFLEAVVDVDGRVTDVRPVYGLEPGLDREAARALRQWKFKPALKDGKPVATVVSVEMTFRLK